MPILNIGEYKNPGSLLWTARAICAEPRVISGPSLRDLPVGAAGEVIDLNQNPVALEDAITMWSSPQAVGREQTIVIDELTRKRLFSVAPGPAEVGNP